MADEPKIALLSIRNHALRGDSLPKSLTLLRWGPNKTDRGTFIVNERTQRAILAQREGGVMDRPLIDFEHNSLKASPTYQLPPRHHAGAGLVFCDAQRGLGQEDCAWTPSGEKFARDYPDISPAIKYDEQTMEVVGLESTGLVPAGGVIGLSFFSAQEPINQPQDGATNPETENMEDLKQQLEALTKALADLKAKVDAMEAPKDVPAEVTAMAAKLPGVETTLADLRKDVDAQFAKRDKDALLVQAAFAGKVPGLTDEAIAKLSAADLKAHIDQLHVTVPLHSRMAILSAKPQAGEGESLLAQFNAISDPVKRSEFYAKHRKELAG